MHAENDVVTQARNANIELVGFGATNPAHTGGGQMRTASGPTSDGLRSPGDAVHRLVYRVFDQGTSDGFIVNETPNLSPGGRPSGIAP